MKVCLNPCFCYLFRYCEERPLLLSNAGMGARLCTYYQKSAPDDQTASLLRNDNNSLGHVISLNPADKSPFLGDTKAGCSQSSLETNMYRAPVFSHKVPSTDYLLVRSAKGKLSIRRIDRLNVVGQQVCSSETLHCLTLEYFYFSSWVFQIVFSLHSPVGDLLVMGF